MKKAICSSYVLLLLLFALARSDKKVDGQWGEWRVGRCSVTCGEGLRPRYRKCDSPPPSNGGAKCVGIAVEHEPCQLGPCPLDGGWNDWSNWSPCSGSCGIGMRRRRRSCKAPAPQNGGKACEGPTQQTEACDSNFVQLCPVNGGWSDWIPFLPCPTDVGEVCRNPEKHQRVRQRFCTSPAPAYGGKDCEGSDFEYVPCSKIHACADGGRWSAWARGSCSVTCGVGLEKLTRTCLDTALSRNCTGPSQLVQECRRPPCRVDGGWSGWHEKQSCKVAHVEDPCAGDGPEEDDVRILERFCNNPPPSSDGLFCQGDSILVEKCREVYGCPPRTTAATLVLPSDLFEPAWSDWLADGPCGVTCGSGLQTRRRKCLSGDCQGPIEDVVTCHMPPCRTTTPLDKRGFYTIDGKPSPRPVIIVSSGGFSQWTEWSACDVAACKQTRWRLCQNVRGGCYGNDVEKRPCAEPTDICLTAALRAVAPSGQPPATPSPISTYQITFVLLANLITTAVRQLTCV